MDKKPNILSEHNAKIEIVEKPGRGEVVTILVDEITFRYEVTLLPDWKELVLQNVDVVLNVLIQNLDAMGWPEELSRYQLETLAISIASSEMNKFYGWKKYSENSEKVSVQMNAKDVAAVSVEDHIYLRIEKVFGRDSVVDVAAPLMKKTPAEFESWLAGREAFWLR